MVTVSPGPARNSFPSTQNASSPEMISNPLTCSGWVWFGSRSSLAGLQHSIRRV